MAAVRWMRVFVELSPDSILSLGDCWRKSGMESNLVICVSNLEIITHLNNMIYTVCNIICRTSLWHNRTDEQSIVCAWRELTNKSTEWNVFLELSNSRRRRTWFTHVRVAVWSNIIQVFYDKKWSCDHFRGLYDGEFIWLYGNIVFMVICCSPS